MENKKKYEAPTLIEEIIELDDVIATSGFVGNGNQDGDNSFSFNVFDLI